MSERILYAVVSGEYDDRCEHALYDDRELAEALVAAFVCDEDFYPLRLRIVEKELNLYLKASCEGIDKQRIRAEAEKRRNREWEKIYDKVLGAIGYLGYGGNSALKVARDLDPRNKPAPREKIGQEW